MALDRRSGTRYIVSHPLEVSLGDSQPDKKTPLKLVDINFECARISSHTVFDKTNDIVLQIAFPDTNENILRLPVKVEETRSTHNNTYDYILRFASLDEKQKNELEATLTKFAVISDRRLKKDGAVSVSMTSTGMAASAAEYAKAIPGAHGGSERRLTKPIFLKCLKFNRPEKMMSGSAYYYLRELQSGSGPHITVQGREMLNFGSNNYLGLTMHPEIIEAAVKATEKYGVGSGGVRILSGTLDLHNQLERRLARFKGGEDCVIFSTGYTTNLGAVSALVAKTDHVIVDSKAHASIIDGSIFSGGQMLVFRHNDMRDLEKELRKIDSRAPKMIITDGVFSMDGDIAKLDLIYELGRKYNAGVWVDEAHATGVLGKSGKGTPEHFGLEGKIDIVMGTLSKALGAVGGFVVANRRIVHYLKHAARPFMFTTSLPPAVSASLLKAIDVIETQPIWRERLWNNIRRLKSELLSLGFDTGQSESAIIPVFLGDDYKTGKFTGMLEEDGVFVSPVLYPAVRRRESRLRVSVMATHTEQDIEQLVEKLKKIGRKLAVI